MPDPERPGASGAARPDLHDPTAALHDSLSRLPHTGPARLPERVLELEAGLRVTACRTLRPGDACLNEAGLLPGVLLVELMAQVGGLLVHDEGSGAAGGQTAPDHGVIAGIKRMHLHGAAGAGETILVECSLRRRIGDLYMIDCRALAGDRDLAHGTIQIRAVKGSAP